MHSSANGKRRENAPFEIRNTSISAAVGLAIGAILWRQWLRASLPGALEIVMLLAGLTVVGALLGWLGSRLLERRISAQNWKRVRQSILPNETFVMVELAPSDASRVLPLLRDVGDADPPVIFAFHPATTVGFQPIAELFRKEAPSRQRLAIKAARLAQSIAVADGKAPRRQSLLGRLRENEEVLKWTNASLNVSAEVRQSFALSTEWLLDNAYLIQGQVNDIRRSLPQSYYEELPLIASGPQAGLPRVYRIASEIIAESDGALDADTIRNFLIAFQAVTTLKIGELWAMPQMLRLRLIECLRSLAIEVEQLQRGSEEADFWANRLIAAARRSPERLLRTMEELVQRHPEPAAHFASELVAHLYDEEAALPIVTSWLERSLRAPLLEVVQQEHRRQAVQQASLSNVIGSCRRLPQIQWRELFEAASRVDTELARDPAGIYERVDFETRNRYRDAVEEIARWSKKPELEIVALCLALAAAGKDEVARHVGYYLIDDGRRALERQAGCRVPLRELEQRWLRQHGAGFYFGNIFLLTALAMAVPLALTASGTPLAIRCLLSVLLLLPANELAVLAVNYLVTALLPPRVLPKMSFRKEGIPDDCRTLVVVPMLMTTPEAIRAEVNRLEIRYLANPDPNLRFALLSDFGDAPQQQMPEDVEYFEIAVRGIAELNERHGADRFFLFHRARSWSESEQRWIGWERKRGKLEQLNRYLMGESAPELDDLLRAGDPDALRDIRFVITLDSDTQLLRDTARRLIETLAHPLNQPRLSADGSKVVRGYTIIQPRVSATLPSATATWFSRIFADSRGIDPYTHAVSDVYQDLTGEGSYHGKGIYDLRAFHHILSGRFPEAHLLSHDLLEGSHVRVALATDIELLDVFPSSYISWWNRQHRWVRGDWQIIDWLRSRVPGPAGSVRRNALSVFNQWKIFDNLRRSLIPVATIGLLLAGWFLSGVPGLWSSLVAGLLLWPVINSLIALVLHPPPPGTRFWREPRDRLIRSILAVTFLLDYAGLALNAITRVAYRRLKSHRLFLEWETAQAAHTRARNQQRQFVLARLWIPGVTVLLFNAAALVGPAAVVAAAPFLTLWLLFPVAVVLINRPARTVRGGILTLADRKMLRATARRTWSYFDEFVGPQTNWLPPDNVQETPGREIFLRTSPTNIGLWMLATVAANDFGYITIDDLAARNHGTLETLTRLERFEGHFLNWYDIAKLEPLNPRYVSTVDSGNLLASLWTFASSCAELTAQPLLDAGALRGLADALEVLREVAHWKDDMEHPPALLALQKLLSSEPSSLEELIGRFRAARAPAQDLAANLFPAEGDPRAYWPRQIARQVASWNEVIDRYLRPVEVLATPPAQLISLGESAHECRREALTATFSLRNLARGGIPGLATLLAFSSRRAEAELPSAAREWLDHLAAETDRATQNASQQLVQIDSLVARAEELERGMAMGFLYDEHRRIFAIGYQVGERRLDNSFYDLLASEARLTSLLAIARGDVPLEHWWALGRPFGSAYGRLPLLSWSGTMFEYLMPILFTRTHENSLLDRACHDAVHCQIAYAENRGVPWGISESAFSAVDRNQVYQYHAFGVPALALKRGQERDLVIAPYASALALGVLPVAAVKNLRRLALVGDAAMVGDHGYFEAIDYSRRGEPGGAAGIAVHCYMVHHQGMSLLAFDNALHNGVMRRRFHSDPRIRATEPLLHEHIPSSILPAIGEAHEERPEPRVIPVTGAAAAPPHPADTVTPRTQLLSNGNCSAMITNSGGGYLRWHEFDVTRWRADTTRDVPGSACYVRDLDRGTIWSTTNQPVRTPKSRYTWIFTPDKAAFRRTTEPCDTFTEVVVSAEDDAEVRRVTLVNISRRRCRLELTTYAELALAPHKTDRAHPAFNKLFIETEWLPHCEALLARRRPRSADDRPIWVAHLMVTESATQETPEFETDRARFIGRGRNLENPAALISTLTNSTGSVLDPIFSLRRRVTINPNQRFQFSIVTVMADSREAVIGLAERYSEFRVSTRAFETAWTRAQLELRRLHIRPNDIQLFQQLAGFILFPQLQLRPPPARLGRSGAGQRALWALGISGDMPIVVVTIAHLRDIEVVREVLTAHTFWHLRGLKVDLVLLSEEVPSYEEPLTDHLRRRAEAHAQLTGVDQPGGVFLRSAAKMSQEELAVLLSTARAVLVAARGTLRQQLAAAIPVPPKVELHTPGKQMREEPSPQLPFMELAYFNGLGGFTRDGKEYAIYLGPDTQTPAPWVNILANPNFGTLVSESGTGFTWYGNSQSHRLTPWFNDPVSDPAGDTIYLRDEDLGVYWTPTPLPIREQDAYRVRHGQGYSIFEHNSHAIEQELLTFVPVDSSGGLPLRVQRLRLRNLSSHRRRLAITSYASLVLGPNPEETRMHVVTKWDRESQSIFARNPYDSEFGDRTTFATSSPAPSSFSGDRTAFVGRNRSLRDPAAMEQARLNNDSGAGLDPCAALQLTVELAPGDSTEVVFLFGQAANEHEARALVQQMRDPGNLEAALEETRRWWDNLLDTIQVETPESSANILLNRWLLYQTLSCRVWGRSGLYQSSGAYGFRDQLQDVMALTHSAPEITREQILRAAARQFVEGDVQHWWLPETGAGVRTRISDDLLWLPFVTAHYVRTTGDSAILDEVIPFIEAPALEPNEAENFSVPSVSSVSASLLEHCRRAITRATTSGPHGLPLIGAGDWNDGLNRVGIEGKGESVWLAWFEICVRQDFLELLDQRGEEKEAAAYRARIQELSTALETQAWDGAWYRRGYYDDGSPLGSKANLEARIDSIPQTWAAISGVAQPERTQQALASLDEQLVRANEKLILLFTPPFDKTPHDVGYIKGYPPGVRENGGQYTHAAVWVALAFARQGDGDKAVTLLRMLNPVEHARDEAETDRYKVEPYAVAGDVYSLADHVGRGGWSWYTGAAGWIYRVWLEEVLGFRRRGDRLTIEPVIPGDWPDFRIHYRYQSSHYDITIENPGHSSRGVSLVELDGVAVPEKSIDLRDDGQTHAVRVVLR
ncbi:MAG: glucoamylase family protein [Spartobacteria bacterium]